MKKLKKAAAIAGAAEVARQWVRNNPDKAQVYIDKAAAAIDGRTGGKYAAKVRGASSAAKKAVAKEAGITPSEASSSTVPGTTTPRP